MSYLGIDIGTSGCKAAIVEKDGRIIAESQRYYSFETPKPGWKELNPSILLSNVISCIKELESYSKSVTGISVCSIGESMVMLDKNNNPVTNCILYIDQRSSGLEKTVQDKITNKELYIKTFLPPSEMYSANRLVWYMNNSPEIISKTKHIVPVCEYISFYLTGIFSIDYTQASRTMLFDAVNHIWLSAFAEKLNIDLNLFPVPMKSGTPIGQISIKVANELGINSKAIVYIGGHDQPISTLGGGAFNKGNITLGQGSTESVSFIISPTQHDLQIIKKNNYYLEPYISDDLYVVSAGQLSYGTSINWFIRTFEGEKSNILEKKGINIYDYLDENCNTSTDLIFIPYLSTVNFKIKSSMGTFTGISTETKRNEMYRALIEGLSFETRRVFETLCIAGRDNLTATAGGGCTKSNLLMQTKSDITNCIIKTLKARETGIVGLAILCALSEGTYSSLEEATNNMVHIDKSFSPNIGNKIIYNNKFRKYKEIREELMRIYEKP